MNEKQGITLSIKQLLAVGAMIILLIVGGVLLGTRLTKQPETPAASAQAQKEAQPQNAGGGDKPAIELDENAGQYTGEKPQDRSDESAVGIKIPGYPSIAIKKDTQDVVMALLNPEGNPCYFKFVIELKDSGEKLFESKYVKPGDCIYDVHLEKPLAAGEYPAVIKISTISLDGETPLNGANVETLLIAK